MNSKTALFAGAWVVTCTAAFLIGRTDQSAPADGGLPEDQSPVASSRGSSRSGNAPTRRRVSRLMDGDSSASRSERIRERARELKAMSDPIARAQGFLDFVQSLGPEEFLDAVDAFREGGLENEQFGEYRLLLTAWAEVDPTGALAYASEKTGTPFARQTILAAWAKNDPLRATEWARANFDNEGDENRANPWLVGVIEGLASYDTDGATRLLEELPFSRERGDALGAVFDEITAMGHDFAKQWVASLGDEQLKAGAAARLARTLAREDPEAAAAWAASLGPEVMARATGEIIDQWADTDLTGARTWIETQAQEIIAAAGPNLIDEIIQQEDIGAASDWLRQFEGNPEFDNTIRSFVWNSVRQEPTVAADWIMKMTDERDRTGTFHRILGRWMEQDRAGAIDYINNNPVPESIKRRATMSAEQR